ncbi:MAG: response regulator [Bacteroidales bacterium]|nr:response regulator [Bacteroidales bacterium]
MGEKIPGQLFDDSDQLQSEIKLLQSHTDTLIELFNWSPVGLGLVQDGIISFVNDKVCKILGYSQDEIAGKSIEVVLGIAQGSISGLASAPENGEHKLKIKNKKSETIDVVITFSELGKVKNGYRFSIEDITNKLQTATALQNSERLYRTLIETSPDLVIIIDSKNRIEFVSLPEDGWSLQSVQMVGKSIFDFFDFENRIKIEKLLQALKNGIKCESCKEFAFDISYDCSYYVEINSKLISEANEPCKYLFFVRNITLQKETEHALIESKDKAEESDRLKTAFLANMSHEIRTPMNGIMGFAQMLTIPGLSDEKKKYYADIITESSQQLLTIVDDILDISKIETGLIKLYPVQTSVSTILNSLYSTYQNIAQKENLKLQYVNEVDKEFEKVYIDDVKLKQVLNNLLSNAFKFIKNGSVEFGCRKKEDWLEFYVKDTGIGIPKDQYDRIFERFHQIDGASTRKFGGTGLGLTIAKAFVAILGGSIYLESEIDKGSVFYFTIPYHSAKEDLSISNNNYLISKEINRNVILVVEDEDVNYLFIEEIFADTGVVTIHAKTGREAVDICNTNNEINVVLMDIKMPEMNGYEALAEIRKTRPNLPIIAQTAYAMTEDKKKVEEAGFNDYISKPISIELLIDTVNKYTSIPISL